MTDTIQRDVLVVGSGIAGLTFALRVAEFAEVVVITKKSRPESSTNFAQGGLAAVVGPDDSPAIHRADTLRAGAGLCHHDRVSALVEFGPQAVQDLLDWGVRFSQSDGRLALGIEAGHSRRRIVHSQDRTGVAIETALLQAVARHPRIEVLENHMAADLLTVERNGRWRCGGARVLDVAGNRWIRFEALATLLATGGCGALYRHTTNPEIATGDGVAMAYRAGAVIANMEFVQFHPTALYPARERAFLISEALRGEGAKLRNEGGEAFMARYHPAGDLAPRDVVARAVHQELRDAGTPHVWLDATGLGSIRLEERFPHIRSSCLERGIDIAQAPIPVVPAAHYSCGGIWTGMDGGSSRPGLFAAGECACTGVHGANRLASNSLLEAVVFAERAASRVVREVSRGGDRGRDDDTVVGHWGETSAQPRPRAEEAERIRERLRDLLWEDLGIVRHHSEIEAAREEIRALENGGVRAGRGSNDVTASDGPTLLEGIEAWNALTVAALIARCAHWRRESRGLHYDVTYPHRDNEAFLRDTMVPVEGPVEGGVR